MTPEPCCQPENKGVSKIPSNKGSRRPHPSPDPGNGLAVLFLVLMWSFPPDVAPGEQEAEAFPAL